MDQFSTLPGMVKHVLNSYRNSYAINDRVGGKWEAISTEAFLEKIRRLALGLHRLGLKKQDTVGILANPSSSWLLIDLAIMVAGGISVPFFPFISDKNFVYEVNNAKLKFFFVVGGEHWPAVSPRLDAFEKVITVQIEGTNDKNKLIDLDQVMKLGDAASQENPALYAEMVESVKEDDLATIIYTSGSTGIPKGVELTHKNILAQLRGCAHCIPLNPRKDRVLSFLPLAHMFERMLMYYYLSTGTSIYFADDLKNLTSLCNEVKPTVSAMVPLIIEKIYSRFQASIEAGGFFQKQIGRWASKLAHQPKENILFKLGYPLANRFVYQKIVNSLGGHYKAIIVGGAPLHADLCQFFHNVGIPLYQGYGLTESSPVLSSNYKGNNKFGTVGKAFPEVEVKLSHQNEILAKGPNIMRGYHNDPEGTRAMIDEEGWLHTGDKGIIDEEGYIKVTGRLKEIMKTSGGKMVAPVPIEQALCEAPFIDMAMVVANERKFVTCLLVPNFEMIDFLQQEQQVANLSHQAFLEGKFMQKKMEAHLEKVNSQLNEWEKVRAYRFLVSPLSVAQGEMTPTFKINRDVVLNKYKDIIDSMY